MIRLKKLFLPVRSMDPDEARSFMARHEEGRVTVLDVRQPSEYEEGHISGAKLIPLPQLHDSVSELDPELSIMTYCAVGGRSRVAAQLLSGLGFMEVYNLKGGIQAWNGRKATGPEELNLDMLRGDETPDEIVALAYAMETGLQTFYRQLIEKTKDRDLQDLFGILADFEENHKKMLREVEAGIEPTGEGSQTFGTAERPTILEGGFKMKEFMEKNELFLDTVKDVIDLAMMLETQALDLYLRFAHRSADSETKYVLYRIADEEKRHLAGLGDLLEQKI
jgi:rhodanese-related sulfurtransferase